ncbi:MAG TPA: lipoyl(octanoyl) transferase LipB [Dehalococcoidales bacterium]
MTKPVSAERVLSVFRWLEPIEYREAYERQKRLWSLRLSGEMPDILLLLEHPPTFTIGKSSKLENLLLTKEELAQRGISLFFTDRGGDITYHGPGQLVAYPIIDLRSWDKDIHRYIRSLEEVTIRTLADFSIAGGRDEKHVGVWVGSEKIAAIGVGVRKWVTMHGLALNVNPNLEHFALINPCGILDRGVTSMTRLLGHEVPIEDVAERLAGHFAQVFSVRLESGPVNSLGWD